MVDPTNVESADVVVLGAGIGGLRAAAVAAEEGARVVVVEKQAHLGGSAAYSAGMFWTAPDLAAYQQAVPRGDTGLAGVILDSYDENLTAIRESGVRVDDEDDPSEVNGFGRGYSFDVRAYLPLLAQRIRDAHGTIVVGAAEVAVERGDTGFTVSYHAGGSRHTLSAANVILATGGFQASPAVRSTVMPAVDPHILVRSNSGSVGDGLRLARMLGGASAGDLTTFYGHLVPHPVVTFNPEQFLPFAQFYSEYAIAVTPDGRRFADESRGDELLNQDLAHVTGARAFLIFDHRVRTTYGTSEPFRGFGEVDRYFYAVAAGAHHAEAPTLDALVDQLAGFGVDAEQLRATLAGDTSVTPLAHGLSAEVPRPGVEQLQQLRDAPFYAVEVQPSITFTLGGIAVDGRARVLNGEGVPITGLFAVGADIGGLSNYGYVGGLAPAHILGTIAGRESAGAAATVADASSTNEVLA